MCVYMNARIYEREKERKCSKSCLPKMLHVIFLEVSVCLCQFAHAVFGECCTLAKKDEFFGAWCI